MSNPKISVIMPVFNTQEYLEEALLSILNQTIINDIEVIMIDDGSTDNSKYIIDRYSLDYENFHAYHKENEGQGIARNYGLTLAKGEFIHFMDSDDYLDSKAYELMYNLALKNNVDMVCCNALRFARYNVWEDIIFQNSFNTLTGDINKTSLNEFPQFIWDSVSCNKLYKKDFLLEHDLKFPNKKIFFEDLLFALDAYLAADSITFTKEVLYYWRFRNNNSSVTQKVHDLKNFKDRINILKSMNNLLDKYNVNEEISDELYLKWLNHDLKFYLKRLNQFPKESHENIFNNVREIMELIPANLIKQLTDYKRILFEIILNDDFKNFILFAPLENDLFENLEIPEFLPNEYVKYFDFHKALSEENLFVYLNDVGCDESNLIINYEAKLNYLSSVENYSMCASLVDLDNEYSVNVSEDNIIIPLDLIKDKNHLNVKIKFKFNGFEKIAYLKNNHRQSLRFDEFDVDLNLGTDSYLFIDINHHTSNNMDILDITFDSNQFIFKCKSKNNIENVFIQNIISFEKIYFDVNYVSDNEFNFVISYDYFLNAPVKKWELNCDDSINSIKILGLNFEVITDLHKIKMVNSRNKIFIEIDIVDQLAEFRNLIKKNSKLMDKNSKLQEKNFKLKDNNSKLKIKNSMLNDLNSKLKNDNEKLKIEISNFKSRKVVKLVDKFKIN